jgi:hypothetical protein
MHVLWDMCDMIAGSRMSRTAHMARMSVVVPEALLYARRPAAAVTAVASLMFPNCDTVWHS